MEEIGSKKFGKSTMYSIGKYLRCILLSKTSQEWDEAYNQAIKVLDVNPNTVSIVITIH